MGKLDPEDADEWTSVDEYEHAGHDIEIRVGGYLHEASFVDGELVAQDHDNPNWVREQAEIEAEYRAQPGGNR